MRRILFISIIAIFGFINNCIASSPSFDCNKATKWHEKKICSISYLSDNDREISENYKKLKAILSSDELDLLVKDQKKWLMETRQCENQLTSYGDDDSKDYGKNIALWCLTNSYSWRKIRLHTALLNKSYIPYRKKPSCSKHNDIQKILKCYIKGIKPVTKKITGNTSIKIYDYPFDGLGNSMLLSGEMGKTYIVNIGDYFIYTSEIIGDNSCCYNKYQDGLLKR